MQDGGVTMNVKKRILFLCMGNSCRSQMAEGFANHLLGDTIEAYSAGIEKRPLDKNAAAVMAELGIDISQQKSKLIYDLGDKNFDYVITVCDQANEACPIFPGKVQRIHAGFDDPPRLAANAKNQEEALMHYRKVRDEIQAFVLTLPRLLNSA